MDAISKMINAIMIIFGMFVVTTSIYATLSDRVTQESITVATTKFSDTVRKQGKLTQETYNDFVNQLNAEGILFNIDMTYAKEVYNPTGNEGSFTSEECYYSQDLLDGLFRGDASGKAIDGTADGVVYFSKGDTFTVHITNRSETLGEKFRKFLPWYALSKQPGIDACAGGLVRDEVRG